MADPFDPVAYLRTRVGSRFVLGVTGPPGAGKSTFAARLVEQLGPLAIVLPMDGFHLSNAELDARGLRQRKGAPDTYDVAGFMRVLELLRSRDTVLAPAYSRVTHEPEPAAITIEAAHQVVVVEGNYLLVECAPWADVRPLLDEVWYLDVSPVEAARRLRERHLAVGRTPEEADSKVAGNDLPNGVIVAATRVRADRWLHG